MQFQIAVPGFKNYIKLALLLLTGTAFAYLLYDRISRQPTTEIKQRTTALAAAPEPVRTDTISISIVGDLMVGSNYPSPSLLPPESEGNILQYAMPLLRQTDLRIGNLESVVSNNAPLYKNCKSSQCYAFRTPYKYAQWYKDAQFDYLSLANNHSFDFGMPGIEHTLQFLKKNNIRTSGVPQKPYDIITVRDTKIGFVSFAPHSNCLNMNDEALVQSYVKEVKSLCDILIVFFHGGGEGPDKMHTPKGHQIFLRQDRGDVRKFAHMCIDEGADLVVGSGPHVVRGMDMYKGKLIAYSLGNFATYHQFNLKFPNNVAPLQQIKITRGGVLTQNKIFSFLQKGEGIPVEDLEKNAYKLIRSLSEEDFGFKKIDEGIFPLNTH